MKNNLEKIFLNNWRPYFWIALIIFIIFFQTLFFNYVYLDDNALILEQSHYLSQWKNIPQTFKEDAFHSTDDNQSYYRPLLTVSLIIDAHLGGTNSLFFYHFSNIIQHILATILLFIFLLSLNISRKSSFILSVIYALHPLALQTIAFIPGRNDSLLAIFFLGAFITANHALKNNKTLWWLYSFILYAASLFTKETAIAFLPLLIIYILLFVDNKGKWLQRYLMVTSFTIVTVLWLYCRSLVLNSNLFSQLNTMLLSILHNLTAVISYIGKIFFPVNLSALPVSADLPLIYGIVAIVGLGCLIYFVPKKNKALIIFGIVWFFFLLLPSLIQNTLPFPSFSEHRMYLPIIGIMLIFAGLKIKANRIVIPLISIFIICITAINIVHARIYDNRLSFWQNAIEYSPSSAFNHNNLGAMYYLNKKYTLAEQEWLMAAKLNPKEKLVQNNLGLIYAGRGEFEKAYNAYNKELKINPLYPNTHFNLGLLLYNTDNIAKALEEWNKTIKLDPEYFSAYEYLALYYINNNDIKMAQTYIEKIIEKGGTPSSKLLKRIQSTNTP